MAEEIPFEPPQATDQQDDVLGKIDQLLNRHRPKPSDAETVPVLTNAPGREVVTADDGIPILTDVVTGSAAPPSRPAVIDSVLMLRRMAMALEAEHARLLAQTGGDAAQALLLGRLVAELKRVLPAVLRAGFTEKSSEPAQPADDGRL